MPIAPSPKGDDKAGSDITEEEFLASFAKTFLAK
jgi:hypothetical protein